MTVEENIIVDLDLILKNNLEKNTMVDLILKNNNFQKELQHKDAIINSLNIEISKLKEELKLIRSKNANI